MSRTRSAAYFALLGLTLAAPGFAQDVPAPPPPLYLMADCRVDVAKASDYETALKDLLASLEEHGFPIRFDTYSTYDSHYYIIYGIETYAGIDGWKAAWSDWKRQTGPEAARALGLRLAAAETGRDYRFWHFRADISYLPQEQRLKPEEIGHYSWDYVWLHPGAEAEFEALNKDWIELCGARGALDPFLTYAEDLAEDGPVYCWFEYGRSAADYAAAEESFWRALGDEGAALSQRTRALIRKMETKTGRYRPDLSYAPRR